MKELVAKFEPGDVVVLNSGGELSMTVTSIDGPDVEVCYATASKVVREKLLAVQLRHFESKVNSTELASRILFLITRPSRELRQEEQVEFDHHLSELFKLLRSASPVEGFEQ